MMHELTKHEELVLLAIWRLKDNAYGISIRKNVMEVTKRELHYGSLYNTLYQLVKKDLVATRNSEPASVKGGRSKVLYSLTRDGINALAAVQEMQKNAWDGLPDFNLMKE